MKKKVIFLSFILVLLVIVCNSLNNVTQDANNTIDKLKPLIKEDNRIETIIQNHNDYPKELLEMLSTNIDMIDFVLNYPQKKYNVYSDTIDEVTIGTFPLLLQYDERWGYASYGEDIIAISGCAPTSLAMVIAGLTGNNTITPYTVAKYAEDNGYYTDGIGTSWNFLTEGSKHFGIKGEEITLSKEAIFNSLKQDNPIICSMRPGDFTTVGHFIVLTGIKEGKIIVNDPNSKERSNKLWNYETLEHQIKNLWSFSLY